MGGTRKRKREEQEERPGERPEIAYTLRAEANMGLWMEKLFRNRALRVMTRASARNRKRKRKSKNRRSLVTVM